MLHKIAIGIAFCMLYTLSIAQLPEVTRVYFDYDKFELRKEGRDDLMALPRLEHCKYVISGHTDSRGSNAYNQELSKNRMEEVRLFLRENGVMAAQIESQYFGEEQPWRLGENEESWKVNRRVDVLCTCAEEKPIVEEPIQEFVDELLAQLDVRPSTYFVSANKDTMIHLEKGGILHLYANSLEGVSGEAEIEVRVKEYYSMSDMVLGNLNTRWGKKLLESGGMVFIEVLADGEPVNLKSDAKYELRIPTRIVKSNMGLWYGSNSATSGLGWLPAGTPSFSGNPKMSGSTNLGRRRPGRFKMFMNRMFNRAEWNYWKKVDEKGKEELEDALENAEEVSDLNESAVKYYVLTPRRFGYINCDRYTGGMAALVDVKTNMVFNSNTTVQLIIPGDLSIMPAYVFEGKIGFPNIPLGKRCKLVAFKVEKGNYFLGETSIFLANGDKEIGIEEWTQLDLEGIKDRLRQLDNV